MDIPPLGDPSVYGIRRDSLVRQASIDRVHNEGIKRRDTIRRRLDLEEHSHLSKQLIQCLGSRALNVLTTDGAVDVVLHLCLIISPLDDSRGAIPIIIQTLLSFKVSIEHLESRVRKANEKELELCVECKSRKEELIEALTSLVREKSIDRIDIRKWENGKRSEAGRSLLYSNGVKPWFPAHVSELDMCANICVKYEPTEDPRHPGYGDKAYIARRAELNAIANAYKFGDSLPIVQYTEEENRTWSLAYSMLKQLRSSHACLEYQRNISRMEADGVISEDAIPHLRELSMYLQKRTGFELRPCGGMLSARDFLASLAFRVFQTTLYVRHPSSPHHCPEPDIIHEVLGHCPMFIDPHLAQISQDIGLLSLGASDAEIERLSTLYWFIVEFGLCREKDGSFRAIGAGLLSAYGELQYACSDEPQHKSLEPESTALMKYIDADYQPGTFGSRVYARKHLNTDREVNVYNPLTRSVNRLSAAGFANHRLKQGAGDLCELVHLLGNFAQKEKEEGEEISNRPLA